MFGQLITWSQSGNIFYDKLLRNEISKLYIITPIYNVVLSMYDNISQSLILAD